MRAVDRCVAGRPTEALPQNREILAPSFGRLLSAVRQGTRAPVPPRPSCPRCAAGRPAGSDAPRTLPEVQVICRVSTRKQLTEFTQFVCLTPRRVLSSTSGLLRTQLTAVPLQQYIPGLCLSVRTSQTTSKEKLASLTYNYFPLIIHTFWVFLA